MNKDWVIGQDYPTWLTEEGLKTLERQHLQEGETPVEMYERVANHLATYLPSKIPLGDKLYNRYDISLKWGEYLYNGWLAMSTPVAANTGTKNGLPISCYIARVPDSVDGIYSKVRETALLTKAAGGVGITFDKVRGAGEPISAGGFTEGVVPFIKVFDSAVIATSQGGVRRGAFSINLPVRHKDIKDFLKIREPKGDINRQCLNIHQCVTIDDYFMERLVDGDKNARELWGEILSTRMKTGEPYIMYYHNAHNQRPADMVKRNLKVDGTNICTEIILPHSFDETVVCCLSSVNLAKYDEWKDDKDFIELCYLFLDCVMSSFIEEGKNKAGLESAVRFATKGRAIGLGMLGLHTYLQENNIPFCSLQTKSFLRIVGDKLKNEGELYNKKWGKILGAPEWCDTNRNLTLRAIAPNTTSSIIVGGVSQSIEPIVTNVYVHRTAKGTFIRINPTFKKLIQSKYPQYDNDRFWTTLAVETKGSVQHLDFLTDDEKEVFLTAYEINQLELVKQIGVLQKYIDQGISTNLFFPQDVDPKWINKVHLTAWEEGLKTLYYVRTESILSKNMKMSTFSECLSCHG